ncbi:MAG: acyl-CoA synthetase FdrA [Anaerolineales bacterium]|nr:acyl-CoA synthetase FdrA [Anaerolineales bacterium]
MKNGFLIRKNQYYDSVFLMGFNSQIMGTKGVQQSAVLMATDTNKEVLVNLGFHSADFQTATPNDLIIAVIADTQSVLNELFANVDHWLTEVRGTKTVSNLHSLSEALEAKPAANLTVISVPGEFAAYEAKKSLEAGVNVFLFSDNVPVEDEISLKKYAYEHGLLVMGPDCGTSLLQGIGIGFANSVRKGNIGAIAAAGTGLQEFTCMVHNQGYGISHAIGTGGRDLSDAVGGLTTLSALDILDQDSKTDVIAIIAKPPSEKSLGLLIEKIKQCRTPVIGCFLGIRNSIDGEEVIFKRAKTIDEAVFLAIRQIDKERSTSPEPMPPLPLKPGYTPQRWLPEQRYLRGIFAGGTFCYQSQEILNKMGIVINSNAPLDKHLKLQHPDFSKEHTIVDMGDDFYTAGKPHPMIDSTQRKLRILTEANDPQVAILLLDFILGYNSSKDPARELIDSIQASQKIFNKRGGHLTVVASICGTDGDIQDITMQTKLLNEAGVVVFNSNAQATEYCGNLINGGLRR